MQLSDKQKTDILNGLIDIFKRIYDQDYQKRVWIRGEGPEVDDFDDTVCDFFGECDPILENYKDFGITERQYKILKDFRDQFRIFADENYHPLEFIDSSEWAKITKMAEQVFQEFPYKKARK